MTRALHSRDRGQSGFTLIELVIAIAILTTSVLTMLYLRVDAVNRAGVSVRGRALQRLAQEKLDEVMFGLEDRLEGDFEQDSQTTWVVETNPLGDVQDPEQIPLVECTITLTSQPDDRTEPEEYSLSSWFFPPEGSPILEEIAPAIDDEEF